MMDFWAWQERREIIRRDRMLGRVQPSQVREPFGHDYEVREGSMSETMKHRIYKFFGIDALKELDP